MKLNAKLQKLFKEKKVSPYHYQWAEELLPAVRKAVGGKNGHIYADVLTVAKSGMSRTIDLKIVHKGEIISLNRTPFVYCYADGVDACRAKVRIYGCGMDMLFEATYRLFNYVCPERRYQSCLNRYERS